jgi:hypothetical protein
MIVALFQFYSFTVTACSTGFKDLASYHSLLWSIGSLETNYKILLGNSVIAIKFATETSTVKFNASKCLKLKTPYINYLAMLKGTGSSDEYGFC